MGWTGAWFPGGEIHLTGKCHHAVLSPGEIRAACAESLRLARTDYLDFYLLHWPRSGTDLPAALEAMMGLMQAGAVRWIGVVNCAVAHPRTAVEVVRAPILCNQIKYRVMIDQAPVLSCMRARGLRVAAHVPLAPGWMLAASAGRVLPVGMAVALRRARLHVPVTRPVRDGLIAATALVHNMTVVTRNLADPIPTGGPMLDPWDATGSR